MVNPNHQLEAALARFAAQPGTTPEQEAQLRAAVVADADRLGALNRQAAAGQIKGFALEAPIGTPNLTGTYDKAPGVITVPAASFQPRFHASCMPVFMPWPPVGGWICAASPARRTRPTR